MPTSPLTPLQFTPLFKTAIWGGTRLRALLNGPPSEEETGEAWLLSDQGSNQSIVSSGPWKGTTLRELMTRIPERIVGTTDLDRFPILLKLIDAAKPLSIQVHPTDELARTLEPNGDGRGKTEAWVILEATADALIYAGLQPDTTADALRAAVKQGIGVEEFVAQHVPQPDDCFFLRAGTVHAIGGGLLLFEVQQTSDVTYRLSDWDRVDPKTGTRRELHLEKGLKSINYAFGPCAAVSTTNEEHQGLSFDALAHCEYFTLDRWEANRVFRVGAEGRCRVIVGIGGSAALQHGGEEYPIRMGDVWLLPAEVGACECVPNGSVTLLECGFPVEANGAS